MRPSLPIVLALLCSIAAPALARSELAQQCAAFGESQYRQLDPSVDRVTAVDFPPPALERFNGKAGSQPVAAALTLRGRLTYRNRAPFETQFVCLLDGGERPLFFYALPALAARPAPTPAVGRGGAPVPQLQQPPTRQPSQLTMALTPPAAPRTAEPARPGNATRLRGLVRDLGGRLQFMPCDGAPLALEDRTERQELLRTLRELTAGQEGRPMFVEVYGVRETGANTGIGVVDLRRAAVETAGCRERFDQREWIASGNEPSWRLEVTSRDMVMSVLGGLSTQRVPHGGPQKSGGGLEYASTDGTDLLVTIDERRCIDNQSGSLFAYVVEVRSEGRTYPGCAAHNPAMPAP
ncbi:MAG: hypothetical protein AB7F22_09300 [Reyranella sp.]|uniref:hypothetical protein n=1 Tax=Reyranella sp. TaxID=1929291 RepID=UPI003D0A803D